MPDQTAIDRLFVESTEITKALQASSEMSLQIAASDNFRKALLLAAASYFEHRICNHVLEFVNLRSGGSVLISSFVRNKAIARQYHSWFEWEGKNANKFFALFGPDFRALMSKRINESESLKSSVAAFLEVGNERNKLVHQDYATFAFEKTLDEVYRLYKEALPFVELVPAALSESENQPQMPNVTGVPVTIPGSQ
jgi:hypothetical protein